MKQKQGNVLTWYMIDLWWLVCPCKPWIRSNDLLSPPLLLEQGSEFPKNQKVKTSDPSLDQRTSCTNTVRRRALRSPWYSFLRASLLATQTGPAFAGTVF